MERSTTVSAARCARAPVQRPVCATGGCRRLLPTSPLRLRRHAPPPPPTQTARPSGCAARRGRQRGGGSTRWALRLPSRQAATSRGGRGERLPAARGAWRGKRRGTIWDVHSAARSAAGGAARWHRPAPHVPPRRRTAAAPPSGAPAHQLATAASSPAAPTAPLALGECAAAAARTQLAGEAEPPGASHAQLPPRPVPAPLPARPSQLHA